MGFALRLTQCLTKAGREACVAGTHESTRVVEWRVRRGVRFTIARMSFGRRVELMGRIRDLAKRAEFLAAGQDASSKMDAGVLQAEVDRLYVTWGVKAVRG